MKVSVVMAVYNGGERMRRTIDSVLAQTYKDFEFLCINDGSKDSVSAKILDEYAKRDARVVVIHRENRGVCETLNECYKKASGDFVARTDQDDVFHPRLLEYCVEAIEKHRLDFLSFRYARIEPNKPMEFHDPMGSIPDLMVWNVAERSNDPVGFCNALTKIHTDTWSHFLRKDLAVRHPFHPEMGLTRVFAQIKEPINWASSEEVLYYYDAGVTTSMTHQPFSVEELMWDMEDVRNTIALYAEERKAGDPIGEWAAVCRGYVLKYIKINYNKIRHSKKVVPNAVVADLYKSFAKELRYFFGEGGVPIRYAKFKHKLAYLWLMHKYRHLDRSCDK